MRLAEIILQRLFVEWNSSQPKKVILEIIQIPRNRLPVETRARIANFVIQIASRLDLKTRQPANCLAVRFDRGRSDRRAGAMARRETRTKWCRRDPARGRRPGLSLRHRFPEPANHDAGSGARIPGRQRSLRAHRTKCRSRAGFLRPLRGQTHNLSSRSAELTLQRQHPLRGHTEMPLEQLSENFHECD